MTVIGWLQIILYCAIIVALTKPLGWYMTRVFNGEPTFLSPVLRPIEAGIYWISGVDERREQHWVTYTVAMLLFHVGGFLIIYGVMRLQAVLPFNPAGQGAVAEDLSFNSCFNYLTGKIYCCSNAGDDQKYGKDFSHRGERLCFLEPNRKKGNDYHIDSV